MDHGGSDWTLEMFPKGQASANRLTSEISHRYTALNGCRELWAMVTFPRLIDASGNESVARKYCDQEEKP